MFGKIELYYDSSLYRYNNDSTIVEIYYSFLDSNLSYTKIQKDIVEAKVNFSVSITNVLNKQIILQDSWDYPIQKNESDSNTLFSFLGVRRLILPQGEYIAEITATDNQIKKVQCKDTIILKVITFPFTSKPQISGILMANIIENVNNLTFTWDEMFRKDNLYILPNPSLEYQSNKPDLQFYFEVYNFDTTKPQNIAVSILDANKREMLKSYVKLQSRNQSFGKNLTIPLDLLPTGVYYLIVELLSENNNSLDVSSKKFYYLNDQQKPMLSIYFTEDQIFEQSEFVTMDEKTLNDEYRRARIVGTNEEMKQWQNLIDLKAKQRFLFRFWRDRDSDPTTVANETKILFDEKVKYANTYFAITKDKEGWNTDRGRILLKYGEPTMISNKEEVGLRKAYQTWQYDEIQGGVEFVFVDQIGTGHYILVHSTAKGEIYNPYWYDQYILKKKDFGK